MLLIINYLYVDNSSGFGYISGSGSFIMNKRNLLFVTFAMFLSIYIYDVVSLSIDTKQLNTHKCLYRGKQIKVY